MKSVDSPLGVPLGGFFMEVYRKDKFKELGIPFEFVQDNHSRSMRNVVREAPFRVGSPDGETNEGDLRQRLPRSGGNPQRLADAREMVRH